MTAMFSPTAPEPELKIFDPNLPTTAKTLPVFLLSSALLKPTTHCCVTSHLLMSSVDREVTFLHLGKTDIWRDVFLSNNTFYILADLSVHVCLVSYILASQLLNFLSSKYLFHLVSTHSRPCCHTTFKILSAHFLLSFQMMYSCAQFQSFFLPAGTSSPLSSLSVRTLPRSHFPPTQLRFHGLGTLITSLKILLAPLPPFPASYVSGKQTLENSNSLHTI